uniref:Uncharacterized protein n=1 Tax=viral metagenome TaxID=1070528 RepID=A0A6C0BC45_9ZZZZ
MEQPLKYSILLLQQLPMDLVKHCLSYDKRFVIRKGCIIQINRLCKNDIRYSILKKIPIIEYNKTPYNQTVFASYLDATNGRSNNNKYYFALTIILNTSMGRMIYYLRKIDSVTKKEVDIKRYNILN